MVSRAPTYQYFIGFIGLGPHYLQYNQKKTSYFDNLY